MTRKQQDHINALCKQLAEVLVKEHLARLCEQLEAVTVHTFGKR